MAMMFLMVSLHFFGFVSLRRTTGASHDNRTNIFLILTPGDRVTSCPWLRTIWRVLSKCSFATSATLIDNEMTKDFVRGALRPGATSYLATDLQC
jgi:hypothetical protein